MAMEFEQRVDKERLRVILNNPDIFELKSVYHKGIKLIDKQSIYTLYNKFLNNLDHYGRVNIKYEQHNNRGRRWPKEVGITNITKGIRHAIAGEFNIDVDIVNCHPVFLKHLAEDAKINTPHLDKYLESRDAILESIGIENAKDHILAMINGRKNRIKNDFLQRLDSEFRDIRRYYIEKERILFERMVAEKKNIPEGSLINILLIDIEDKCLMSMVNYMKSKDVKITSLAYDGLTIERTDENLSNLPTLLRGMEQQILDEVGISVSIIEKEMNKGVDIPEDLYKSCFEKCMCNIPHSDIFRVIAFLKSHYTLKDRNYDFYKCLEFLKLYFRGKCLHSFILNLCSNFESELPDLNMLATEIYNETPHTFTTILELCSPRASKHVDIRNTLINAVTKTKVNIVQYIKPFDPITGPFDPKYDIFDFAVELRKTVYEEDEFPRCVAQELGNYIRPVLFPCMYVINKGGGLVDIGEVNLSTRHWCTDMDTGRRYIKTENKLVAAIFSDLSLSSHIPIYNNITFNPDPTSEPSTKEYNMYTGMVASPVEDVDMDVINPILYHIKHCWADGNRNMYDYILQWFRHAWLYPTDKTGVVLLLFGLEGTGKGLLIDNLIIPHIYGDRIACVSQGLTPITQRFNSICMNKLFICCNEVSTEGGFHMSFEKLKALITDKTMSIEKKGIDIFKDYPNYINFIFTTNNTDSVKLGRSDRRYCCLETSKKFKGNYEYFEQLVSSCTQNAANHFYTYVINLPKTRNIRHIPTTQLKMDMMINSTSSVEKYISDMKDIDFKNPDNEDWIIQLTQHVNYKNGSIIITGKYLYESYKMWCKCNTETIKTSAKFGRECKVLLDNNRGNKGILYTIRELDYDEVIP